MAFVQRGLAKISIELSGWKDCGAEGLTDMSKVAQRVSGRGRSYLTCLALSMIRRGRPGSSKAHRLWLSESCNSISSFSGMSGWGGRMHKLLAQPGGNTDGLLPLFVDLFLIFP